MSRDFEIGRRHCEELTISPAWG